ncbi:MAG TPA: pitrilysin family protein [Candidatus Limnocylindrales bacterium]|nr:pitrilysin family protein [Candidatus Limnocylindrales bacterium]
MSRNRKTVSAVIATLVALFFLLGSSLGSRAAVEQTSEASNVLRATLPNGLRVVIVRDALAPVATAVMNYKVGSDEAPAGFPGTAHAEEHMMFRGNPGLSADQLAEITAAMGGNFDADTQDTVTQYFFTVPSEDIDVALHIEALRMSGVDDAAAQWAKERGAIEQEVAQDYSNPFYVFYSKLLAALFHSTPYEHDALGTRPSFDKTTAVMLQEFYKKWYAPNNAVYVITGDVDPPAVLAEVKKLYGGIPEKKLPPRTAVNLEAVKPETLNLNTDFPFGVAAITFRMPGTDSPDYATSKVLADVLSSERGSLYDLVPTGKALFAEFTSFGDMPRAGLGVALAGYPKGGDGAALVKEIQGILADDVKNGLPADLVEAAKRHELADAEFRRNSISGLAFEWSNAVAVEGRNSPQDDVEAIQKVTPADVDRLAREYLTPEHAVVAVLTPQPSGKPISQKSFGGQESFAPSQVKPVALPKWASSALARLTIPTMAVHPVVSTLPNGLKVIVVPENASNTVSVFGRIKNNPDLEQPKGEEGVGNVLGQLFDYGTTTLDRMAYQKALDDIAAHESAGTSFSLQVLPQDFDRGVELLADNELHPAMPPMAFQIVQRQTAASVAGTLQSPGFLFQLALDKALYPPTDPELRHSTPQSVSALTLANVQSYYARVFRPDLTTIVVIGNVAPQDAQAEIAKYFGAWKAEGPKPDTDYPTVAANKPSTAAVPDKSRVQDIVTLAETVEMNRFNPDYYALELGNHVLGGGFYATRLYRDLRMNGGLVYFVDSSFDFGRTRTVYSVQYSCDPPNVSKARAIVVRDLDAIQSTPVTPHELRQAKALLLREIPLSEGSVGSIANGLLSRSLTGLPLDEPEIAARRYVQLTAPDVQAAFAKWLKPANLVQVTQGPNPQ